MVSDYYRKSNTVVASNRLTRGVGFMSEPHVAYWMHAATSELSRNYLELHFAIIEKCCNSELSVGVPVAEYFAITIR